MHLLLKVTYGRVENNKIERERRHFKNYTFKITFDGRDRLNKYLNYSSDIIHIRLLFKQFFYQITIKSSLKVCVSKLDPPTNN